MGIGEEQGLPGSRDELLRLASSRAPTNPIALSIRQLLGYWGAKRRGVWITEDIKRDLAEAKLATTPSFTEGWIDTYISLVPIVSMARESEGSARQHQGVADTAVQVSLRVSSLASASAGVESVRLDDSLERAQALMMRSDYSQLAVQSGPRDLRGAVSWESIAQAKIRKSDAGLRDAVFTPEVVNVNDDLLSRIPLIVDASFVFVQARDRQVSGIVTTADLSLEFATLARPFFLLAEVERRLRRLVDQHFTRDEIAAIVDPSDSDRSATSARDLTIGECARLLEQPDQWRKLGWALDRVVFIEELHAIRMIRNEVMHFSPDPLEDEQMVRIGRFIRLLRRLDPRRD